MMTKKKKRKKRKKNYSLSERGAALHGVWLWRFEEASSGLFSPGSGRLARAVPPPVEETHGWQMWWWFERAGEAAQTRSAVETQG